MSRYKEYKDSGIWWLGEIPNHWKIRKSKYLWKEIDNRSEHGSEQLLSVSQYDGVRESTETSRSESLKGYKIVEKDNLAINIMLAWLGGLGVSQYQGVVSPAYCVYKLMEDNNPRYLHYLYRTPLYLAEFARHSTGIVPSRWRMYTDDFGQVLTLIPPKEEQDAIVAYLDEQCSKIDEAIAQQQKMIDLLNERKQIIINKAVTKGLNPDVELYNSEIEWLQETPRHWKIIPIKRFSSLSSGSTPKSTNPSFWDGDIKWITPSDFKTETKYVNTGERFITVKGQKACSTKLIPLNSIVFSKRAPVGQVSITTDNLCTNQGCIACVPNELIDTEYFFYLLSCYKNEFESLSGGTTFKEISMQTFAGFKVALPPIDEQKIISAYITENTEPYEKQIETCYQLIEALQERKQIIVNDVVTGKFRI